MDTYGHLYPSADHDLAAQLDEVYAANTPADFSWNSSADDSTDAHVSAAQSGGRGGIRTPDIFLVREAL